MYKTLKGEKTSFWQVIQKNTIVIPQIQRDYAQGRNDKAVKEIRSKITDRFYDAIMNPEQPLDIDFVYGYNTDNEFTPLDGQQRLTTLFLIHWYISKRAGINEERLKCFRYETRQSSTDFCRKIFSINIPFEEIENIEGWFKDQRWFFHSWQKDPTIKAMLIMMQCIHEKFKGSDFTQLWENITVQNSITFIFLPIDNTGLTDDLYIKMNSRGKPLTQFENFKVWFEKKYPKNKDWKYKIDNDWTNLFWKYKDAFKTKNSLDTAIDDEFMQFINGMCMFYLAENNKKTEVEHFANTTDILLSEYEKLNLFSDIETNRISQTLDWFYKHDNEFENIIKGIDFWDEKTLLEIFISNNPGYSNRVQFYAVVHYISYTAEKELDKNAFRQWMRVTRNLIENTAIDSSERFIESLKAIDSIKENCSDIIGYLQLNPQISFFLQSQVVEEIKKAGLIKSNINWLEVLEEAENHELFRGSITFLLSENISLECFKRFCNIAMSLFDKSGCIHKEDSSLIRATLASSTVSSNIQLLNNGSNWRTLLKRSSFQKGIQLVLNKLSESTDYLQVLNSIINEYSDESILWKYYIVKNKILLDSNASRSKRIKAYKNKYYLFNNENANWINNDNQFLLSNRRNEITTLFIEKLGLDLYKTVNWWVIKDAITDQTFYRGESIWLKKPIENYNLWFHFKPKFLVIGFHNEDKDKIDIEENSLEANNTWLVYKKFSEYPANLDEIKKWVIDVISEIPAIKNLAKVKQ